jgi:hypothetical protein
MSAQRKSSCPLDPRTPKDIQTGIVIESTPIHGIERLQSTPTSNDARGGVESTRSFEKESSTIVFRKKFTCIPKHEIAIAETHWQGWSF